MCNEAACKVTAQGRWGIGGGGGGALSRSRPLPNNGLKVWLRLVASSPVRAGQASLGPAGAAGNARDRRGTTAPTGGRAPGQGRAWARRSRQLSARPTPPPPRAPLPSIRRRRPTAAPPQTKPERRVRSRESGGRRARAGVRVRVRCVCGARCDARRKVGRGREQSRFKYRLPSTPTRSWRASATVGRHASVVALPAPPIAPILRPWSGCGRRA